MRSRSTYTSLHRPAGPLLRVASIATAVALLAPVPAFARRAPSDVVGGRRLSDAPAMTAKAPDIDAASGILTTADGRVLWERGADERRAMASTTKMMTALVVLERASLDAQVVVPKEAAAVAEGAVNLTPGERLTVRQLLETMMVASANDAAYALAVHVGGSVPGFVALMNAKAASLGLKDTHYANPHGLDAARHYSTARDLAALGRYAMRNAEVRRIVGLRSVTLPRRGGGRRVFASTDLMLDSYDGIEGVKTGMTDKAGYCFVSAARRADVRLFGVVLGATSDRARFTQSKRLLDWGFAHYRRIGVIPAGTRVGTLPVSDWLDRDIVAKVKDATSAVLFDLGGEVRRTYGLHPSVAAPVRKGQVVGVVTALQGRSVLATMAVVAAEDMPAPSVWERVSIVSVRAWRACFGPREVRTAIVTARE